MRFPKPFKTFCAVFMSIVLTNVTAVAAIESKAKMISTSAVLESFDRKQAQQDVQKIVDREDVKKALIERGVSPDEVSSRLASLSDSELKQLSGQIQYAKAGSGILVEILIIVLIIFLIKRM